jgi:hypothetical protein
MALFSSGFPVVAVVRRIARNRGRFIQQPPEKFQRPLSSQGFSCREKISLSSAESDFTKLYGLVLLEKTTMVKRAVRLENPT